MIEFKIYSSSDVQRVSNKNYRLKSINYRIIHCYIFYTTAGVSDKWDDIQDLLLLSNVKHEIPGIYLNR